MSFNSPTIKKSAVAKGIVGYSAQNIALRRRGKAHCNSPKQSGRPRGARHNGSVCRGECERNRGVWKRGEERRGEKREKKTHTQTRWSSHGSGGVQRKAVFRPQSAQCAQETPSIVIHREGGRGGKKKKGGHIEPNTT